MFTPGYLTREQAARLNEIDALLRQMFNGIPSVPTPSLEGGFFTDGDYGDANYAYPFRAKLTDYDAATKTYSWEAVYSTGFSGSTDWDTQSGGRSGTKDSFHAGYEANGNLALVGSVVLMRRAQNDTANDYDWMYTFDAVASAGELPGPIGIHTEHTTNNTTAGVVTLIVEGVGVTPTSGFGGKIVYNAETATNTVYQNQGSLEQSWTTATAGNVSSQTTIKNYFNNNEVTVINAAPGGTTVTATTTTNNAPVTGLTIRADTTNGAGGTTNFGVIQNYSVETATAGTFTDAAKIEAKLTTATAGADTSQLGFTVRSAGADNTPLTLSPNTVVFGGGATATQVRYMEPSGGGTSYVGFTAPSLAANVSLILPDALPAGDGYVWYADTDGTTYFDAPPSGTISGLTTDFVTKATSSTTIGDSTISDDGADVDIGPSNSVTVTVGGNTNLTVSSANVDVGRNGASNVRLEGNLVRMQFSGGAGAIVTVDSTGFKYNNLGNDKAVATNGSGYFKAVTPAADGTTSPVNSITIENGIITAIS